MAAGLIAGAGSCQHFPIYSRRGYDKDADEFKAGQVDGVIVAALQIEAEMLLLQSQKT